MHGGCREWEQAIQGLAAFGAGGGWAELMLCVQAREAEGLGDGFGDDFDEVSGPGHGLADAIAFDG